MQQLTSTSKSPEAVQQMLTLQLLSLPSPNTWKRSAPATATAPGRFRLRPWSCRQRLQPPRLSLLAVGCWPAWLSIREHCRSSAGHRGVRVCIYIYTYIYKSVNFFTMKLWFRHYSLIAHKIHRIQINKYTCLKVYTMSATNMHARMLVARVWS